MATDSLAHHPLLLQAREVESYHNRAGRTHEDGDGGPNPDHCWESWGVGDADDRVQEEIMATGLGTPAKTWFDSLAKSIYTLSDEARDQFFYA